MIHLMLGDTFEGAMRNLMGYVQSYEDKDLTDFFTGMLCTRKEGGSLVFMTAQRSHANNNGTLRFNSEPYDPYKVELQEEIVIDIKNQSDQLKLYFSHLFDKNVTINSKSREAVLKICLYFPIYDEEKWSLAKLLVEAISEQSRKITVDLFLFSSDLAYLFSTPEDLKDLPSAIGGFQQLEKSILKDVVAFKEKSKDTSHLGHIIVMQNCNEDGLSLNLDWDSFVRVIGEFAIATMNSYNDIFQPNAEIEGRPIHSFGLCVLNLDKYYYVKYLLSRAYVTILEREGVDTDTIDVNRPSQTVQLLLTGDGGRYKFYDHFYDHRVKGYIAEGRQEEEINAQAVQDIDEDIEQLVSNITAFLNDDSLSLPEKRVTLAQLLGMDDELMVGDMFNPDQLLFRDTYADCIAMFVNANNLLNKKTPRNLYVKIPASEDTVSGDYPEQFKAFAALGPDEIDFSQMSKDLKMEEVKIRRQTEYIRTLEKDLDECDVQKKQGEEKGKVLTKDGFRYGDVVYRLDKIETIPLEKTYVPSNNELPKSVDLRRNFAPVKNQGSLGACTTFALAGIFEYILNKGQRFDSVLSERYLYYNTRIKANEREGRPGSPLELRGTSFYDAISALQADGICKEALCEYTTDEVLINEKPSDDAYTDGRTRLVTEAKNVELKEHDIKSALNEGYPVAISVRLFSTFGSPDHGFIALPDENEVRQTEAEGIESNHAMIICGYSDENKVFVVRNSWGTDFADKGYCFMPYSYITDPHLTNQACIITETNFFAADLVKGIQTREVVSFDKLNPEINAAIIRTLLGETRKEKSTLVRHRMELYTAYSLLEKRLVNSEVRSMLTTGTIERLKWEIQQIEKQKTENEECEIRRLADLDREHRRVNISFFISLLSLVLIGVILAKSTLYRLILTVIPITKYFFILLGLGILAMIVWWIVYFRQRRRIHEEHAEVMKELEQMEHLRKKGDASNLGLYTRALGIRMFMPWLVLRKLSEKNRQLEQKYQVMVNYTLNLREWYDTEREKAHKMDPDTRDPFIALLTNETLDRYYARHADEITADIRLSALFKEGYEINDEAIVRFQNKLKEKIIGVLEDSLAGFSVYKYLAGNTAFEFAKTRESDTHEMLRRLEEKSKVFIRLGSSPVTDDSINSTTTVLMSYDIASDLTRWNHEFQRDFSTKVSHISIMSPLKISFLQMKRFPIEECLDFYDPDITRRKDKRKES